MNENTAAGPDGADELAARVRRAVIVLTEGVPQDGDRPMLARLAADAGQLRAITDLIWSQLPIEYAAVAEGSRRDAFNVFLANGRFR